MNKEKLKELENFYNNALLLGATSVVYDGFEISKDREGLWCLVKYLKGNQIPTATCIQIVVPDFIQVIGEAAFEHTLVDEYYSIIIPESVTKIKRYAFTHCNIVGLTLPSTLVEIELKAFYRCNLSNLYVPDNVKSIGNGAFTDNVNLINLSLPSGVKIGDFAFVNCGLRLYPTEFNFEVRATNKNEKPYLIMGSSCFRGSVFEDLSCLYKKKKN